MSACSACLFYYLNSLRGVILILDQHRLTGQCDSLFIMLLFPSSAVISFASKQVENAFTGVIYNNNGRHSH